MHSWYQSSNVQKFSGLALIALGLVIFAMMVVNAVKAEKARKSGKRGVKNISTTNAVVSAVYIFVLGLAGFVLIKNAPESFF